MTSVVGSRSGDHRNGDDLDDRGEQGQSLVVVERRRLARRSCEYESVVAVLLQVAGKDLCGFEIEASIAVEWSDHRAEHASESSHARNRR